jgi:hypothetical protein
VAGSDVGSEGASGTGGQGEGPRRISVVITSYDYASYLREAVDSALGQEGTAVEVVVVDDGSTDGSREILRSYGDAITVLARPHRGQAAALNAGVQASHGDLVLLLDADDRLEPDAARTLAEAWRPGVSRVQGVVELIDGEGALAGGRLPTSRPITGDARPLVLGRGSYSTTGTTGAAYGREALCRLLPIPDDDWARCPDSYLLLLAPFVGPVAGVDRVVAGVRVHGGNKWSADTLRSDRLADHLETDLLKDRLLRERGPELGAEVPSRWLLRNPIHLQSRLGLLRTAPELHPFPGDHPWRLGWHGIRASLGHGGLSVRKRVLMAGWFLAASLLPHRLAGPVVRAGFERGRRPAWLQRFVEGRTGGGRRARSGG